jgi:Zn finger protein HypA/HybF involved in hydrogenase expression
MTLLAQGHAADVLLATLFVLGMIGLLWVLPISLGIRAANRKGYSPHWMWFGIHPVGGWIAAIVLMSLPARVQCRNCGGFVARYFRLCPHCHAELEAQSGQMPTRGSARPAAGVSRWAPSSFGCPHCGKLIRVDDQLRGQPVTCPSCGLVSDAPPG